MVFVCKICESNRLPISLAVEEATKILGQKNTFINNNLSDCKFVVILNENNDDIIFEITVNAHGEGIIEAKQDFLNNFKYNHLNLINQTKKIAEQLKFPQNIIF